MDTQKQLQEINELKKESMNFARLDVPMVVKKKQMSISLLVLELTERMLTNPIVIGQMMLNPVAFAQVIREASKIGNLPLVKAQAKSIIDIDLDEEGEPETDKPKAFSFQPAKYTVDDKGEFVQNNPRVADIVDNSVGNVDNPPPIDPREILKDKPVLQHTKPNKQYPHELAGEREAGEAKEKIDSVFSIAQANAEEAIRIEQEKAQRKAQGTPRQQKRKRGDSDGEA